MPRLTPDPLPTNAARNGPPASDSDAALRAMRTAADLFAYGEDAERLILRAARTLANDPGEMCLISLVRPRGDALEPVVVAHRHPRATRHLRRILCASAAPRDRPPADAFSRTAQRNAASLRMGICNAGTLRLWLPPAYWNYAERSRVSDVLAAAVVHAGEVLGTLLLWREQGAAPFREAEQAYVAALADRLAVALAHEPGGLWLRQVSG